MLFSLVRGRPHVPGRLPSVRWWPTVMRRWPSTVRQRCPIMRRGIPRVPDSDRLNLSLSLFLSHHLSRHLSLTRSLSLSLTHSLSIPPLLPAIYPLFLTCSFPPSLLLPSFLPCFLPLLFVLRSMFPFMMRNTCAKEMQHQMHGKTSAYICTEFRRPPWCL